MTSRPFDNLRRECQPLFRMVLALKELRQGLVEEEQRTGVPCWFAVLQTTVSTVAVGLLGWLFPEFVPTGPALVAIVFYALLTGVQGVRYQRYLARAAAIFPIDALIVGLNENLFLFIPNAAASLLLVTACSFAVPLVLFASESVYLTRAHSSRH